MEINVSCFSKDKSFPIYGASYIGKPASNTSMFISKKIEHLLPELKNVKECLVFAEKGIDIPEELSERHCFVVSDNPQGDYAQFSTRFHMAEVSMEKSIGYSVEDGAYISNTAKISEDAYIAQGCVIGPDVEIGRNAMILPGAVIKNAVIGDNVIINENAVIGSSGFTMAEDADGNKIRIYSLGKVIIGDNVEIGAHDNISRGSGGNTVIEDNVKMDALVHIGHDVHLHENVEITAGAVVGGFVEAGEHAYIGINSVIRNRINLGKNCFIGMGATVTKSVEDSVTVVGNPARPFTR